MSDRVTKSSSQVRPLPSPSHHCARCCAARCVRKVPPGRLAGVQRKIRERSKGKSTLTAGAPRNTRR